MDIFELVKEYGVSLVGLVALAYYVKTQNDWITNELQTELRESFARLEGIVIKLIDNSKKVEIQQSELKASYRAIVEILASMSGNGLKEKFMRKQDKHY